ncbi:MAG: hypothetical protein WC799_11390 [Desulfobacteraceae bacterium]|jgi:hypothetical protein
MIPEIMTSFFFSLVTTSIYLIASNIMYFVFNGQTMFKDIYFYDWVEYLVVAGIMLVCVFGVEMVRAIKAREQ